MAAQIYQMALVTTAYFTSVEDGTRVEIWQDSASFGVYMSMVCECASDETVSQMITSVSQLNPFTHRFVDGRIKRRSDESNAAIWLANQINSGMFRR